MKRVKNIFYGILLIAILAIKITIVAAEEPIPDWCINGIAERDCTKVGDNNGRVFWYCYLVSEYDCSKEYKVEL